MNHTAQSAQNDRPFDALFLDLDGTFLDFGAAEHSAFLSTMERFGFPSGEREYAVYTGINRAMWEAFERGEVERDALLVLRFRKLFEALGQNGDPDAAEEVYQAFLGEGHALMEGAEETLTYLKGKYPLYAVTNGVAETQRSRLTASGLSRFMTGVFISEETGSRKPEAAFFDACFALMPPVKRERTLIIGDSLTSDILGGIRAGIHTCWFNPERRPVPAYWKEPQPEIVISALTELKGIL